MFSRFFQKGDTRAPGLGQCRQIVTRAAELATNVKSLPTTYCFEFSVLAQAQDTSVQLLAHDLESFMVVDVETGQKLRASQKVSADGHGRVGVGIGTICPALVRKGVGEIPDLVLRKELILVKFDQPVIKNGKRTAGDCE
jgi:hypothetical protein